MLKSLSPSDLKPHKIHVLRLFHYKKYLTAFLQQAACKGENPKARQKQPLHVNTETLQQHKGIEGEVKARILHLAEDQGHSFHDSENPGLNGVFLESLNAVSLLLSEDINGTQS